MKKRLNFTVGPVMMNKEIKEIGGKDCPYFRTPDFSELMIENEKMILNLSKATEEERVVFLTASGTGGMEMAICNSFTEKDKVLCINGGSFGARFDQLLTLHKIPHETIILNPGQTLKEEHLLTYNNAGFTGFVVNMHETSTGVLYNMPMISDFCKRNRLFLVVDAISAFLADPIEFSKWGIDVMITSSQKALALPPGMSFLVLSENAIARAETINCPILYYNIPMYLRDGERGQTPFTPAVGVLIQLNKRLEQICKKGIDAEQARIKELAEYFRDLIIKKNLPFTFLSETPSNAVTSLIPTNGISAYEFFRVLDTQDDIWICPNGGDMKDKVFRVGHIGALEKADYGRLIEALEKCIKKD